ncbi:MAG: DUF2332 domain-containing protein [Microthrixaceae bacterium]|nr:DUF2332 domain-containing protein [Microthrixaceae bacterium]
MTVAPLGARRDRLLETIEMQRAGCEVAGSPLYSRILSALATDVMAGGPAWTLLHPYATSPVGDAVLLRLLAGVHRLVLEGDAPDLAAHYPSVGGRDGRGLETTFLSLVEERADLLGADLRGGVQTNEAGRSAALLAGFLALASEKHPLRILEVGASAGLNLLFDRFRYEQDAWNWGPIDSALVIRAPFYGHPPIIGPDLSIVERRGCDVDPIDPTTAIGRTRLRSFVWPDQLHRRDRLDDALGVAGNEAPSVDRACAVEWARDQLAGPVSGVTTVLFHTIFFQYLSPDDQRSLLATIESAARQADESAPLVWLRMEPGGDQAEVRLTRWPGGSTRRMARSAYHGPPVALDVQ